MIEINIIHNDNCNRIKQQYFTITYYNLIKICQLKKYYFIVVCFLI